MLLFIIIAFILLFLPDIKNIIYWKENKRNIKYKEQEQEQAHKCEYIATRDCYRESYIYKKVPWTHHFTWRCTCGKSVYWSYYKESIEDIRFIEYVFNNWCNSIKKDYYDHIYVS